MTEPGGSGGALALRLRELRTQWPGVVVTQRQLADALGVSVPLISSWESATAAALPGEDRLQAYARFFATKRSIEGSSPRLLEVRELSDSEERTRRELIDELVELRELALRPATARRQTGALGGRFYYFPDGQPIRIICTRLAQYEVSRDVPAGDDLVQAARGLLQLLGAGAPEGMHEALAELEHFDRLRAALTTVASAAARARLVGHDADVVGAARAALSSTGLQYANPWHPNAIQSVWNGDIDAAIELVGHVRAENPGSDVRWLLDDAVGPDDFTGHVIILGGGDYLFGSKQGPLAYLRDRVELPLETEIPAGGDPEYDAHFVVLTDEDGTPSRKGARRELYAPRFVTDEGGEIVRDHGQPLLEYDVAFLLRVPNPLNLSGTLTVCTGIFSRGTYGAVRALTDASLRARNERYLSDHLDMTDFWLLMHVPVFPGAAGAQTITPDISRPFHRLRTPG